MTDVDQPGNGSAAGATLRLLWPQWQRAGAAIVAELAHCYGDDLAIVWIDSHDEIELGMRP